MSLETETKLITRILPARDVETDIESIKEAAQLLSQGKLVVFPTETVYGIGANALDPDAVAGIFTAKGRPADNPLITHVTSPVDIIPLVKDYPETAKKLAEVFWPGPLTIVLHKNDKIPAITSAGLDTASFRIPSHPVARALIKLSGVPVAAPSANVSGSPSPTTARHCITDLNGRVDMILDGGKCGVGLESTVVSLTGSVPRLLRPGAVTAEALREVLGELEIDASVTARLEEGCVPVSPGMKYRHYAPHAKLSLVHARTEDFICFAGDKSGDGIFFLTFDEDVPLIGSAAVSYGAKDDPAAQARELFSALRRLDEAGAVTVYARAPRKTGVGLAVYNRLLRAAGYDEIYL